MNKFLLNAFAFSSSIVMTGSLVTWILVLTIISFH